MRKPCPEDHSFRILVQRQDLTGAERSWASHYEINDVVRYTRDSNAIGIEAAAYASVVAIDTAANLLTVEKAKGELASYDPRRLTGVSIYQEIERELSVGDRLQFTAPDKSLRVANRDIPVIEPIRPDGRLSVRLDNNRQIKFNPNEHRHLHHGYAVTSHTSQGLTAERVLVHADTSVLPDLLNCRFAYVSISRASHEATFFTDDMAKLGPQLGADVSRPPPWKSIKLHPPGWELGWDSECQTWGLRNHDDKDDDPSRELQQYPRRNR